MMHFYFLSVELYALKQQDQQYYHHHQISFKFYQHMNKATPNKAYKNAICVSVGLLIIFTTSIFVAKDFFENQIKDLIDDSTLLKDSRYADWGKFPGNIGASYSYKVSIADHSKKDGEQLMAGQDLQFDYSYRYKNISFGQGDQGFIKYLHDWQLKPTKPLPTQSVTTINLEAERAFSYEKYAPVSRKFTIMYNYLWNSIQSSLTRFYSYQLYHFYFKHQEIVTGVVFKEAGVNPELWDNIITHPVYGWNSVETFETWVMLCNQKNYAELPEFQLILESTGLSKESMERLLGPKSMMATLTSALNGTIKLILQNPKEIHYTYCDQYCNNNQLVAFQILTGALTSTPIFLNVNMQKSMKDYNSTILSEVEFKKFCVGNQLNCNYDETSMTFLSSKMLGNFSTMSQVFANIKNINITKSIFGFSQSDDAQNFVQFLYYLQDNVFKTQIIGTNAVDEEGYYYMINNYIYINRLVNDMKDILNYGIYVIGFANFLKTDGTVCENFYKGVYGDFLTLCENKKLNFDGVQGVKAYIDAYQFKGRNKFLNITQMSLDQISQFLRLDKNSLFVQKMKEYNALLKQKFGCSGLVCTLNEFLIMEWSGKKTVLDNLPDFFPPSNILGWDVQNKLNGYEPQYYKVTGEQISNQKGAALLGSGQESLLVFWNLLNYKAKADSQDPQALKFVNYIQKTVIDLYFSGPYTVKKTNEIVKGYKSFGVITKQNENDLLGGSPWLQEQVALFEINHKGKMFNKIKTGIYNKDNLRSMQEFNRHTLLGSEIIVYKNQYEEVIEFLPSGGNVFGTNLLGFHSDLTETESLSAFLDFAHKPVILIPKSTNEEVNQVNVIQYSIKQSNSRFSIGRDEQNQRFIQIDPSSSFSVDPITGATIAFFIKYTVSTESTYLKYYPSAPEGKLKLYETEISFSRKDVDNINKIVELQGSLNLVYIITIILASLSMVSIVVFSVLYKIKSKKSRNDLNDTLISSETGSIKV